MEKLKKVFGGINLNWKKLIIFAIIAGIYTAVMAILPITRNTSFEDISIQFEWWILFGIFIICNSKSPKDSALKCFVFFLISQPLIYLIQVPFSSLGWQIFMYYKYWFIWTLLTLPMGFVGFYIKKNNILSAIILLPMLVFLSYLGLGYFSSVIEYFPHHLLSCISCFAMIIVIVIGVLDKLKLRLFSFGTIIICMVIYIFLTGGFINSEFEVIKKLNEYNLSGDVIVSSFISTKKGNVDLIPFEDSYNIKLNGRKGGKYTFTLQDESNNEIKFEYYFDENSSSVVLNKIK